MMPKPVRWEPGSTPRMITFRAAPSGPLWLAGRSGLFHLLVGHLEVGPDILYVVEVF
jgi:hypothetical protein